jgi:hypothetical protein
MKASAVGVEFLVIINEEEVSELEFKTLSGTLKLRNREKTIGNFPFELKVGNIKKEQLYSEVIFVPENAYFENVDKFIFVLSPEGYNMLRQAGFTGDRMMCGGCKLKVSLEQDY